MARHGLRNTFWAEICLLGKESVHLKLAAKTKFCFPCMQIITPAYVITLIEGIIRSI